MYPPASAATEGGSQGPQFPAPLSHPSRLHRGPQAESQVCHLAFGPVQGAVKGWGGGCRWAPTAPATHAGCPRSAFHSEMDVNRPLAPAKSPLHLLDRLGCDTAKLLCKLHYLLLQMVTVCVVWQISSHTCS